MRNALPAVLSCAALLCYILADGLRVLTADGGRCMRSYNLRNVSRWDYMDGRVVVWTKTDVDLEERPLTLSGDTTTARSVVDTLASCCMQ